MEEKLALINALWPIFATIVGLIAAGVIRVEFLRWKVKSLEDWKLENDRKLYAMQVEVQNFNGGIGKDLNEIRETLAWIKGRFAFVEGQKNEKQSRQD